MIPFLHFSFDQPVLLFFVVYEGTETFKCDETISSPELGNYCSFASRTAVLYCLAGYTLSALIAILHEICLDALQLWGARGRRGAALDLYALAFLLIGGVSVLYSSSTRFSSFINFLVSRVASNALVPLAQGLYNLLSSSSLPPWVLTPFPFIQVTPQVHLLPETIFFLLLSATLLQKHLSTGCLLFAPFQGETMFRGNPFALVSGVASFTYVTRPRHNSNEFILAPPPHKHAFLSHPQLFHSQLKFTARAI